MNSLRPKADIDQSRLTYVRKSHLQNWYHIRVKLETGEVDFVFMMCDLTHIYDDKLNSVKYYDYGKYYTSRLKERIE